MIQQEQWKDMAGYEGTYSISSLGRIRRERAIGGTKVGQILTNQLNKFGYLQIGLRNNGVYSRKNIHSLVAKAFIGDRPDGYQINHIDGIKTNNSSDNLEYVTMSQNRQHAYDIGLQRRGNLHHKSKISESIALKIREIYAEGKIGYRKIGKLFGIKKSTVFSVIKKDSWAHV